MATRTIGERILGVAPHGEEAHRAAPDDASHRRENHEAGPAAFILRDAAHARLLRMRGKSPRSMRASDLAEDVTCPSIEGDLG